MKRTLIDPRSQRQWDIEIDEDNRITSMKEKKTCQQCGVELIGLEIVIEKCSTCEGNV